MTETYSNALQGYTFPGSKNTNEQRMDAVVNYMLLGTLSKASEACGIPLTTLYDWKKTEWWEPLAVEARNEKEDEHHAALILSFRNYDGMSVNLAVPKVAR